MSHRRLLFAWVGVFVLMALLAPSLVHADIAPPQPPLGSGIFPGQETTQVRMQAETVLIDLPSASTYDNWQAAVTAVFTMRNLGGSAESMTVRFPMFMTEEYRGVEEGCPTRDTNYPAIQNFRALAADVPLTVNIVEAAMDLYQNGVTTTVKKPCWAEFQVTFPAGQDLKVEVRYQIQGQLYGHGTSNYLGFPYILTTGQGWQGTIGSADIRVRLPYPPDGLNLLEISEGGRIDGNEVRWHFEDFEPQSNTALWMVNPRIWQALQTDLAAIKTKPQDGEAWGRLGKNYKNVFLLERGFREGDAGADLFRRSREAYQRSVTLLPRDADWHFGYGDLLCQTASWNYTPEIWLPSNEELLTGCMTQLQLALQINPRHAKTLELLENMSYQDGVVDMSGPQPNFLILTPGNYKTPTPWVTFTAIPRPTSTATSPPEASATPLPSPTLAASATPPPAAPSATSPAPPTPTAAQQKAPQICGAVLLPLLLGLWVAWKKL